MTLCIIQFSAMGLLTFCSAEAQDSMAVYQTYKDTEDIYFSSTFLSYDFFHQNCVLKLNQLL